MERYVSTDHRSNQPWIEAMQPVTTFTTTALQSLARRSGEMDKAED
jgi:hypothetical protein